MVVEIKARALHTVWANDLLTELHTQPMSPTFEQH